MVKGNPQFSLQQYETTEITQLICFHVQDRHAAEETVQRHSPIGTVNDWKAFLLKDSMWLRSGEG